MLSMKSPRASTRRMKNAGQKPNRHNSTRKCLNKRWRCSNHNE